MHEGHRKRVKDRFLSEGLDNFEPHNMLELLLFYAVPQKDTNETAHRLLSKFGSINGVFDASTDELMTVEGVGEHAATLIKLIPSFARIYTDGAGEKYDSYDSIDKIGKMLIAKYVGISVETVMLTLLDNRFRLLSCAKIFEGSVNSVALTPRLLVEPALFAHASMAVLSHNHPGGIAIPSGDDLNTTALVRDAFSLVGVDLIEHIIVSDKRYTCIMKSLETAVSKDSRGKIFCKSIDREKFYRGYVEP